jgi:hypothetical protein
MAMKIEASPDDILKLAYGGKTPGGSSGGSQKLAEGGMTEGPSHEGGGVDVYQQGASPEEGAAPVAEIEGGERVFSVEDTEAMEAAAEQIIQMMEQGQQQQAEDMAMRLGFAVVDMIAQQERNQEGQEAQMAEQMNQFENG